MELCHSFSWLSSISFVYMYVNQREFEWTLGVGDGQGGLVCCNSWGHKESDTTEQLTDVCMSGGVLVDWWTSLLGGVLALPEDPGPRICGPLLFSHSVLLWSNLPISCGTGTSGQGTWLHSTQYLPVLNLAARPLHLLCWAPLNPGLSASVSPHSESPISTRRWGSAPSLWQTPLPLIQGWAQGSCSWESSLILLTLV